MRSEESSHRPGFAGTDRRRMSMVGRGSALAPTNPRSLLPNDSLSKRRPVRKVSANEKAIPTDEPGNEPTEEIPDGHSTSYGSRSDQTDRHTRDSSPGFGKMPRMKRTYPVLANRSITDRLQTGFRDGPHGKARNEASDRKGASRSRNARETITGLPILPSENRKSELFRLSWACRTRGERRDGPKPVQSPNY